MVLEEEIWFSSEEEAQECARIFKGLNVSVHIRTKVDLDNRVIYKAPYTALKGVLEEEISWIQEENQEDGDEITQVFQDLITDLSEDRGLLEKTFSEHNPGDHIGIKVFDVLINDGVIPDTEESMDAFLKEATLTRILELNNLLDLDEQGMILSNTISPDDAVMSFFGDDIPPLREESLKKWNIIRSLEAKDTFSFIVTTGPDVVFLEELTDLEDFFERIEYDENTNFFFINLQVKQVLVAEILSIIQNEGHRSKDELITDFMHRTLPIEDEKLHIGLHLSPGYIEGVLSDLKKIGILKGKDSKLKIVIS
jgi:hypothetical protein